MGVKYSLKRLRTAMFAYGSKRFKVLFHPGAGRGFRIRRHQV